MDRSYAGHDGRRRSRSASASDEDENANGAGRPGAQGALLRLIEDYPTPLTLRQRRLFFRHVAFHVRRYQTIQRASHTVLRGWDSLHTILSELRTEKASLEQALRELDSGGGGACAGGPAADAPIAEARPPEPAPVQTEATAPDPPARPRRIMFGARGGRGGGVFAHLQSVLQTAQKEEVQKFGDVRQARERIAKQTRLQRVQEDLALHDQYFAPLEERRLKCEALETECRENFVVPLLALQHALYAQEGSYAAAFALCVSGPVATGSMFGADDDDDDGDAAGQVDAQPSSTAGSPPSALCSLYCTPATYTDDVLDVIRSQVEDVLDDYLTYRARMDPVLSRLEQEQAAREAQKVGQLMSVMGLDESGSVGGSEGALMESILGTAGVGGVLGAAPPLSSAAKKSGQKPVRAGLGISDEDEDEDVDDALDLMDAELVFEEDKLVGGAAGAMSGAETRKKERAQIQSALSVLDDFESMF